MGFFSRFKKGKRYKFNKNESYHTRWLYYQNANDRNPIANRKKKRASYSKYFNLRGYKL